MNSSMSPLRRVSIISAQVMDLRGAMSMEMAIQIFLKLTMSMILASTSTTEMGHSATSATNGGISKREWGEIRMDVLGATSTMMEIKSYLKW